MVYVYTCLSTSENLRLVALTALAMRLEESKVTGLTGEYYVVNR